MLICGFLIYFEDDVYLLDYEIAKKWMEEGKKGIALTEGFKIDSGRDDESNRRKGD